MHFYLCTLVHRLQDSSSGTVSCVSTLCLPDVTTRDQLTQAFPLHTCIPGSAGGGNNLEMRFGMQSLKCIMFQWLGGWSVCKAASTLC